MDGGVKPQTQYSSDGLCVEMKYVIYRYSESSINLEGATRTIAVREHLKRKAKRVTWYPR